MNDRLHCLFVHSGGAAGQKANFEGQRSNHTNQLLWQSATEPNPPLSQNIFSWCHAPSGLTPSTVLIGMVHQALWPVACSASLVYCQVRLWFVISINFCLQQGAQPGHPRSTFGTLYIWPHFTMCLVGFMKKGDIYDLTFSPSFYACISQKIHPSFCIPTNVVEALLPEPSLSSASVMDFLELKLPIISLASQNF